MAIKAMAAAVLALLGYASLTASAVGPSFGDVRPPAAKVQQASLHFSGTDPIITGSVGHLFEVAGTFVGPNEGAKQDRHRIDVDVMSLTKGFDGARTQMAALVASPGVPTTPQTVIADSVVPVTPPAISARIALAAVDPSAIAPPAADTPALNAIDNAALDPNTPVPALQSRQLAYARADTPATVFPDKPVSKYSDKELWCLSQAIYFEARGESYRGQVAVAQVVMNRLAHPLYPKTICGVVFQDEGHRNACQFSFACDGIPEVVSEKQPWEQANQIAEQVASGALYLPEVGNATHYHATYVYPDWAPELKRVTKIGMHIFYKFKNA